MSNPTNPFDLDDGIENIPVVKGTAQAVKNAAGSVAKQTNQQKNAAAKSFVNQLYGVTDTSVSHHAQNPAANPHVQEEESQLAETRKKLQQQHMSEYYNPTIGDLETELKREEQKRVQVKQQEEQQEEQQKHQMEELEEKKNKQEPPIAVQIARSKSERRPGAG